MAEVVVVIAGPSRVGREAEEAKAAVRPLAVQEILQAQARLREAMEGIIIQHIAAVAVVVALAL